MEKKAQIGIGVLVVIAVAIIVGLVLFQAVAQEVGKAVPTTVTTALNSTGTGPAIGSVIEFTGQELVSVLNVANGTDDTVIPTSNYTMYECVRASDGLKGICYKTLGKLGVGPIKASYTYWPAGYVEDSGARSITSLIVILAAIAIALVVLGAVKYDFI